MIRMRCLAAILSSVAILAADAPSRFAAKPVVVTPIPAFQSQAFSTLTNETIVWIGPENSVIEQEQGWIEAYLLTGLGQSGQHAVVRHMGWEGDTVYRQNRMENWGSWRENLDGVDATSVFLWFGGMEALQGDKTTGDFIAAYEKILDEISLRTKRLVLVTPPPFERPQSPFVPDQTSRNDALREYVRALRDLAQRRHLLFVDLFTPFLENNALMRDGVHLSPQGLKAVAPVFVKSLGVNPPTEVSEKVREAVIEKNRIWFDTWRPMNWAFAFGDRTTQPFAQGAQPDRPLFVEELRKSRPHVTHADTTIQALLHNSPLPEKLPEEPPRADPPGLSAEEEKSHFKLRDGFDIHLFADEKLGVIRPTQIRWDERGRLWVVCAPSYPQLQPGEKANDFILILEDTDGDGRADKSTRWAEGLKMPMGMEFGPDGIYVCESTKLVYLRDADHDGRADQRTVLFSGFGTGDSHQNINSVRWGADGHLWFSQGYHIWSYVETPLGIVELNRSGVWRLNPRTLKLESFLNDSAAGLNCWGVTFDDYGQVFHGSGADYAIWHTTPALIPTLHALNLGPGLARSKGKSTEPEFLGSSHLPDDLRGVLLKSIYFTSEVGLYRLRDDGAGYVSEDLGDLISSSGPEFRPLETRVGPDGAIYICDWFNPVIGHYQASYRDPRRDRSHGRIWRMTAQNRKLLERPKLGEMGVTDLILQLHSPERWNRDQAKYLLYRLPREKVLPLVLEASSDKAADEPFLYELSGVLAAHETANASAVERFLNSKDFRWRAWGTRLAGLWSKQLPKPLSYIRKSASDPNPRVRMEAVIAASTIPSSEALKTATLVLDQALDPFIEHSLTLCIHHLAPQWRADLAVGKLDFGDRYHALARVLATAGDTNVVDRLREILRSGHAAGLAREKLLATLVEYGSAKDMNFGLREEPNSEPVFNALVAVAERHKNQPDGDVVRTLLQNPSARASIAGCKLAITWNNASGQLETISRLAASSSIPEVRQAAIAALAKLKGEAAWSEIVPLTRDANPETQRAAIAALARIDTKKAAQEAAQLLSSTHSTDAAGIVLSAFLNIRNGIPTLAEALQASPISPTCAQAALQWLAQNGRDDQPLLQTLRQAAQLQSNHLDYSEAAVKQLLSETLKSGDASSGSRILRRAEMSCLGCHRIGAESPALPLGPDLSAIGRSMTPELIIESVLWPKRQIKEGFLLTQIAMKDGSQWQGYKIAETRADLTLRSVDGTETQLRKTEMQQRSDVGTLMPDGLTDSLASQERLDLLRYLLELGK